MLNVVLSQLGLTRGQSCSRSNKSASEMVEAIGGWTNALSLDLSLEGCIGAIGSAQAAFWATARPGYVDVSHQWNLCDGSTKRICTTDALGGRSRSKNLILVMRSLVTLDLQWCRAVELVG